MLRLAGDATPVHLRFRALTDVIATSARYWQKENDKSGWTLMFKAASLKLMMDQKMKAGVFELYGVLASLHWHAYLGGVPTHRDIHVHCMPRILQDGRSSTLFNGTFRCVPELAWEDICKLCKLNKLDYFAICVASDECPAMLRCETELADKVKQHNEAHIPTRTATPILLVIIACLFHLVHRMVMRALGKQAIPNHFYIIGACVQMNNHMRIIKMVRCMLEVEVVESPGTPPPCEYTMHSKQITAATLKRTLRTSSRSEDKAKDKARLDCVEQALLSSFSGCWWLAFAQHYGSGRDQLPRETLCTQMAHAYNDAFLWPLFPTGSPSMGRWHTHEPTLTACVGAGCVHEILPRAFHRAFVEEIHAEISDDSDGDEVDWHKRNTRQIQKAAAALVDRDERQRLLRVLIINEPADSMNQNAQHMEETHGCLRNVVDPEHGIVARCQRHLLALLQERDVPVHLETVRKQFICDDDWPCLTQCNDAMRNHILELSADVDARIETVYFAQKLRSTRCADPNLREDLRLAVATELLASPPCDRDALFLGPLLERVERTEDLVTPGAAAHDVLERAGDTGQTTNSGCERLLALYRSASPKTGGVVDASLYCCKGMLSQMLTTRRKLKRSDCRVRFCRDRAPAKIPTRANQKFVKRRQNLQAKRKVQYKKGDVASLRGRHFKWVNAQLRSRKGLLGKEQFLTAKREVVRQWNEKSVCDKQRIIAQQGLRIAEEGTRDSGSQKEEQQWQHIDVGDDLLPLRTICL